MLRFMLASLYVLIIFIYTLTGDNQAYSVVIALAAGIIFAAKTVLRLFDSFSPAPVFGQIVYLFFICTGLQVVLEVMQYSTTDMGEGFDQFQLFPFIAVVGCVASYFRYLFYHSPYYPPVSALEALQAKVIPIQTVKKEKPVLYYEILNEIVTYPMAHFKTC